MHRRERLKTPGAATTNKIEAGVVRQTGKKPAPRVRSQAHKRGGDQSSKLSNSVSQEKAAGMLNVSGSLPAYRPASLSANNATVLA